MRHPKQQALTQRLTVERLVETYMQADAEIREGFAKIAAAEKRLNDVFTLDGFGHIQVNRHRAVNFEDPNDALNEIRREIWGHLIDRLDIRRMCSNTRWEQLQKKLKDERDVPPITQEMVGGFAQQIAGDLESMLKEKVEEVFNWLRPPQSRYKSNSEYEVPEKVVLAWAVERHTVFNDRWRVCHYSSQRLIALESVFSALDGTGEIVKSYHGAIGSIIMAEGFDGEGETPHFKFRVFKNGNMHLWFKRKDLLARFNALAGGARLKASTSAA